MKSGLRCETSQAHGLLCDGAFLNNPDPGFKGWSRAERYGEQVLAHLGSLGAFRRASILLHRRSGADAAFLQERHEETGDQRWSDAVDIFVKYTLVSSSISIVVFWTLPATRPLASSLPGNHHGTWPGLGSALLSN